MSFGRKISGARFYAGFSVFGANAQEEDVLCHITAPQPTESMEHNIWFKFIPGIIIIIIILVFLLQFLLSFRILGRIILLILFLNQEFSDLYPSHLTSPPQPHPYLLRHVSHDRPSPPSPHPLLLLLILLM